MLIECLQKMANDKSASVVRQTKETQIEIKLSDEWEIV